METSLSNHSNHIGYTYTLFATLGIRNHDANGICGPSQNTLKCAKPCRLNYINASLVGRALRMYTHSHVHQPCGLFPSVT